jgi:sugar (pentulose or hexulose) kinase
LTIKNIRDKLNLFKKKSMCRYILGPCLRSLLNNGHSLYLGIDLGTSSVKVAIVDRFGKKTADTYCGYSFISGKNSFKEQDPQDWIFAIQQAIEDLKLNSNVDLPSIRAIGLSVQMPTLVLTNWDGKVMYPAIVWCDNRADEIGIHMRQSTGANLYRQSGVILDGRYLVPMFRWLQQNEPQTIPRPYRILSAKDYILYWLTGEFATDPSTASGFGVYSLTDRAFDIPLCEKFGVDTKSLPEIHESIEFIGGLRRDAGLPLSEGTPVCVGSADSVAAVLGMGAVSDGDICMVCGSSTAIVAVTSKALISPKENYMVTPLALPGNYGLETDILSTGSSFAFASGLLNVSYEAFSAMAQASGPGANGILFYPYLAGGEQGALWDPELSGTILGLNLSHGAKDIARALFEGIAYESRRCVEAFEEAGYHTRSVILAGKMAQDDFFAQLVSNVLDKPVSVRTEPDASAVGAAYIAAIAAGEFTAEALCHQPGRMFTPGKGNIYFDYYIKYIQNSKHAKVFGERKEIL